MSKSSPLDRSFPSFPDTPHPPGKSEGKITKPGRKSPSGPATPLQTLTRELNWDLAKLKGASSQLQGIARKYNLVIPKILFKNVHAADLIAGLEKELIERVNESRTVRVKKLKEPAPVDNAPPLG